MKTTILVIGMILCTLVGCKNDSKTTFAMSPCQCKASGGCEITWYVPPGRTYADGTRPEDYDKYGVYSGPLDVPDICRTK